MNTIPLPPSTRRAPRYICEDAEKYRVRIVRGAVTLRASIPKSRPNALAEAMAIRDRFIRQAGAPNLRRPLRTIARSNTGITGISEGVVWRDSQPRDAFTVNLPRRVPGQNRNRRVYYGPRLSRADAFARALQIRAEALGCRVDQLVGYSNL